MTDSNNRVIVASVPNILHTPTCIITSHKVRLTGFDESEITAKMLLKWRLCTWMNNFLLAVFIDDVLQ